MLRHVIYEELKITDGHFLTGELCQENMLASVDVVVLDIPEHATMVAMMNNQLGAFLFC